MASKSLLNKLFRNIDGLVVRAKIQSVRDIMIHPVFFKKWPKRPANIWDGNTHNCAQGVALKLLLNEVFLQPWNIAILLQIPHFFLILVHKTKKNLEKKKSSQRALARLVRAGLGSARARAFSSRAKLESSPTIQSPKCKVA